MYKIISDNCIMISGKRIEFPINTVISNITVLQDIICFYTVPKEKDLDWGKIETHQIWKERCVENPSELYCYSFDGMLLWKFSYQNVSGFSEITPESKKESEFISSEHYKKYIEKFSGKQLLEVYAGDFRFLVNANSGEIYDKTISR